MARRGGAIDTVTVRVGKADVFGAARPFRRIVIELLRWTKKRSMEADAKAIHAPLYHLLPGMTLTRLGALLDHHSGGCCPRCCHAHYPKKRMPFADYGEVTTGKADMRPRPARRGTKQPAR